MSGHTPGPWEAVEGGFGRHWCVIGSKHQLIGDDVVAGADARLIAASPELLSSLKTLVAQIEDWEQAMQKIVGKRRYPWSDLEEAKKLISRAEGE